ncbi:MAG TPA: ATP-binding protein [Gemmatimonadales bacterium]|nr:ATP-binding protein [Gemmatimonadales bacterium]
MSLAPLAQVRCGILAFQPHVAKRQRRDAPADTPATRSNCVCGPLGVERYLARVSGPLLDRIDIHLEVPVGKYRALADQGAGEPSAAIRESVDRARAVQRERFTDRAGVYANAHMAARDIRTFCRVSDGADALLRTAITRLALSARAYHRILKIARTIADLDGATELAPKHVSEAIQYRSLDRRALG